jgi:hypothetical protein
MIPTQQDQGIYSEGLYSEELARIGLPLKYHDLFIKNEILTLEDILLMRESDFRELKLPIGLRNRIMNI